MTTGDRGRASPVVPRQPEQISIFWEVWHDLHPAEPLWPTELDATATLRRRRQSIMDHDTPEPSASDGFLDPEEHAFLQELDPKQWTYTGTEVVKTLVRRWPDGSEDTLIVLSPDTAYVRRDDGGNRKVREDRGTAVEMARLIQPLPAPGLPDAPAEEIPDPAIEPMK